MGDEAIIYGITQTEVTHIITSHELLPKFKNILPHTPKVKHIIYMEGQLAKSDVSPFTDKVTVTTFDDVINKGAESNLGK